MASETSKQKKVLDVNTPAIFLVKDHRGNKYVSSVAEKGSIDQSEPEAVFVISERNASSPV